MKRIFYIALLLLTVISVTPLFAQEGEVPSDIQAQPIFTRDSVPELDLQEVMDKEKEDEKPKKKKVKKKVFYGMKCRKAFTKKGAGKRQEFELFYYLKHPADPDFYVQDVYVWDMQKGKVIEISKKEKFDPKLHKILHGPYKRMMGGNIIEQGIFYIGTKHGRWELYAPEKEEEFNGEEIAYNILLEKKKFYKGWPKESKVTFYDAARKKVKEVYPFENGKLHGTYFYFLENGQIFKRGRYVEGKAIGLWHEYFKDRQRVRVETQYPETPYEDKKPIVLNEWDELNNQIIINGEKVKPGSKIETDPLKRRYLKNKNR